MVVCDSAIYEGKSWNASQLKTSQGDYNEEYRLKMRMESQKNRFTCPECGEPVILCAGLIMEPFFKHHTKSECTLSPTVYSKQGMIARRMIYHLLRDSFGEDTIQSNVKITKEI